MRKTHALAALTAGLFVAFGRDAHADCASCISLPWTDGSCSSGGSCLEIENSASSGVAIEATTATSAAVAMIGITTAGGANGAGVEGQNLSTSGFGVEGQATDASGTETFGVYGANNFDGTVTVAGTGYGSGVYGSSALGYGGGVYGASTGAASAGVFGYDAQDSSYGVYGNATGSGYSWGVAGDVTAGYGGGVLGVTYVAGTVGVEGSVSTDVAAPYGVWGSGTQYGVYGTSPGGYGVYAQTTSGTGVYATNDGSGAPTIYATSGGTGTNAAVYAANSGGSGGYAAYFDGNILVSGTPYCSGCTTFTKYSDERLKRDIKPVTGALDVLSRLRPVTFEWSEPETHARLPGQQRGFVAQEVEKVLPGWVGVDSRGYKTLDLSGLPALTVASIQDLKAKNESLRERVRLLRAGQRSWLSRVGEGGIGMGLLVVAGVIAGGRRKVARSRARAGES